MDKGVRQRVDKGVRQRVDKGVRQHVDKGVRQHADKDMNARMGKDANAPAGKERADPDRQARADADEARIMAELKGLDRDTDPFVAAVRATRMPMIITDPRQPDNPIVFANSAFCRLTGYASEEILGRNCRFLQGTDTDPVTVARLRAAIKARRQVEIDIRNYRKDGRPFWNRLLIAPVYDATGSIVYFFGSQLDVTVERERLAGLESHNAALVAELSDRLHAQEESEARLRFATRVGGLGVWELDLRSQDMIASDLCKRSFGRDPAAPFSYGDLQAAIHPEDRGSVLALIASSIETGRDLNAEYRVLRSDGDIGWVEFRAQVVQAPSGTKLRMAGTSRDITDRRRADERSQALIELDNRFRALDDPADLAYAAAEILGRTLKISRAGYGSIDPAAETITILRDWTAPGISSLAGILYFRDYGSYIEDLKRGETVIFADAEKDSRTQATAAALKAISAQSVVNMPVSEDEALVGLLFLNHAVPREWSPQEIDFVRDVAHRTRMIVARRRAELELRQLAASLETQVAERTQALMESETALRQSQKMEAVGQLTGGIAHDFNNLLTGILGSLDLVRTRIAQGRIGDVDRYLTAATGAANRAASLTHRLLAFSRQQTLEPKVVNMNPLVAEMEELIRRTVGPGISVEVVGSASLWNTRVDPSQLENALLNLCINARDAMPDGGTLTIETANRWLDDRAARARELSAGQYVCLSVSDTGTGMSPDVIAKAFDPFFTTKPLGQGTGLGLSMIYGFARQSGGQARIYSEVGQGTTVRLYLPRHQSGAEADDIVDGEAVVPPAGRGETVLVVDDEPTLRMLATEVLQEYGYTTLEAENGAGALAILRTRQRLDLLVTDVGLPGGMNGRQVAEAARALRPDIKVLFITGYAENAVLSHGHLVPGMHVLTKPFALEELVTRIRQIITDR